MPVIKPAMFARPAGKFQASRRGKPARRILGGLFGPRKNLGRAILAAANTSAKYVGLMGSKRKTILIYEDLLLEGLSVERLKEIRSPIGLDIRARTPEEIAMSIMSEVLMFRLGGPGAPMKLEDKLMAKIIEKVQISKEKSVFSA